MGIDVYECVRISGENNNFVSQNYPVCEHDREEIVLWMSNQWRHSIAMNEQTMISCGQVNVGTHRNIRTH